MQIPHVLARVGICLLSLMFEMGIAFDYNNNDDENNNDDDDGMYDDDNDG